MGKADYYTPGTWNTICFQCGFKRKASDMRRHWQGYYVCPEHWEMRQPQDFVRAIPDVQTPPWEQLRPAYTFVNSCTLNTMSAVPGQAEPGCMIPGYLSSGFIPV